MYQYWGVNQDRNMEPVGNETTINTRFIKIQTGKLMKFNPWRVSIFYLIDIKREYEELESLIHKSKNDLDKFLFHST